MELIIINHSNDILPFESLENIQDLTINMLRKKDSSTKIVHELYFHNSLGELSPLSILVHGNKKPILIIKKIEETDFISKSKIDITAKESTLGKGWHYKIHKVSVFSPLDMEEMTKIISMIELRFNNAMGTVEEAHKKEIEWIQKTHEKRVQFLEKTVDDLNGQMESMMETQFNQQFVLQRSVLTMVGKAMTGQTQKFNITELNPKEEKNNNNDQVK